MPNQCGSRTAWRARSVPLPPRRARKLVRSGLEAEAVDEGNDGAGARGGEVQDRCIDPESQNGDDHQEYEDVARAEDRSRCPHDLLLPELEGAVERLHCAYH